MSNYLRRRKRESSAVYFSLYSAQKVRTREALDKRDGLDENGTVNCFLLHPRYLLAPRDAFQVLNKLFWSWRRLHGHCDLNNVFRLRKLVAQGIFDVIL